LCVRVAISYHISNSRFSIPRAEGPMRAFSAGPPFRRRGFHSARMILSVAAAPRESRAERTATSRSRRTALSSSTCAHLRLSIDHLREFSQCSIARRCFSESASAAPSRQLLSPDRDR
jgi:hypothetical protein